jgi:hypothetical protein
VNYLSGLALNCDSPDISIPSSYDYRCEPLARGSFSVCVRVILGFELRALHLLGSHSIT